MGLISDAHGTILEAAVAKISRLIQHELFPRFGLGTRYRFVLVVFDMEAPTTGIGVTSAPTDTARAMTREWLDQFKEV